MTLAEIKGIDIQNYDIIYTDESHTYRSKSLNKNLPSVTKLIGTYQKPFDVNYWSYKKALENNITKEEQLQIWEDKKQIGTRTGTLIHNYLENAIKNKIIPLRDTINSKWTIDIDLKLTCLKSQINGFINDFNFNVENIPITQECIIGNNYYAGQLDYFGYNYNTNKFVILDFKTDNEFTTESKYKFIGNLKHLYSTKLNKYALQCSLYQNAIMEITDIKEEQIERYIIWFNVDNTNYTVIPVPFMKKEVDIILNDLVLF